LTNKPAAQQIIELMSSVLSEQAKEVYIPTITNRNGDVVSNESILVRITNLKRAFPEWVFYTRTCQQTQKKIIGARPVSEAR